MNAFPAFRPTGSIPTYDVIPARGDELMKKLLIAIMILGLLLSLFVLAPDAGDVDDLGFDLPESDNTKVVLDAYREEETRVSQARRSTAHA